MIVATCRTVLILTIIASAAALLSAGGDVHALTGDFTVLNYHVTDTTTLLLLWGSVVGVIGLATLSVLLTQGSDTAGVSADRPTRVSLREIREERNSR